MIQTIGVIGGGQLGRMFTLDAKRMGYDVVTLDPQPGSPCGQVADEQIVAAYNDLDAVDELGRLTDIVTYEFENIAIESVQFLERNSYRVTPSSTVLGITQDRLLEKQFVRSCGIPVTDFEAVTSQQGAAEALERLGTPALLKTVRGGYDGKGQWRVSTSGEAANAFEQARGAALIAEAFVPFEREISVVCTRGSDGDAVTYPPAENEHRNGILFASIAPARVEKSVADQAMRHARTIAAALDIVGTFCVEFFVKRDGELLVNEIAPRPHNSGHYTIDATRCSQYEQHVRAICNLPLSAPELLRNAVMVNILGTGTGNHLAGVPQLLSDPQIVLHLYGKKHAVEGRKMGHFTMLVDGPVTDAIVSRARAAHDLLRWTEHAPAGR